MSEKRKVPLGNLLFQVTTRTGAYKERDVPYVGLENIPSGGTKIGSCGRSEDSISSNTIFESGDILFGKLRPRLRKSVRTQFRGYCSTDILVLRVAENVHPGFAGYVAQSDTVFSAAIRTEEGTKMPRCSWGDIQSVEVFCPVSNKEQAKIASVLASLDLAIEKTEALIEKYQQIKAGLMHDLFTRGVLPDGKLRPTREQAPELYRETGIGFLPKEWTVEKLENLLAPVAHNMRSGPFGSALLKHELVENGIPFLGIDNVHVERFVPDFKRFVSRRKFEQLAKYKVRPGDVVITIMGTVGRCCVIPSALVEALSSKHLWTMTFDEEKVIPELVCWQLNHAAWAQAWFRRAMQGGIMDAIQSNTLKTLMLPVPSPDEQKLIHGRYDAISRRIGTAVEQLDKLRLEKNGLMHDLLTGKVAVKVDEAQEEHV